VKIEKAIEISDAKISFVSLVDKAANKRQFLITKANGGQARFSTLGKILKVDAGTHYVTGVVYEPLVEDAHGNFMTEAEIQKAAHWFAKNGDKVDVQHSFEAVEGVTVVETYIAPCDMTVGETAIVKGTWIMTAEVENAEVWEKVKKGEVTGFSMGGVGSYSEVDVELEKSSVKASKDANIILKSFVDLFGYELIKKGEVKDKFERQAKSSNFWNAWYALEDTLRTYDWHTDEYKFIEDEERIKEALSDFTEICTAVLSDNNIVKTLAKNKIEKENTEVNKEEIQALIDEAIKKAATPTEPPADEPAAPAPALTEESLQKMIDEAVLKATAPPSDEPLTAEKVQEMVNKALEPVLKSRGLPSNLGGADTIEKSGDSHFLAGIL